MERLLCCFGRREGKGLGAGSVRMGAATGSAAGSGSCGCASGRGWGAVDVGVSASPCAGCGGPAAGAAGTGAAGGGAAAIGGGAAGGGGGGAAGCGASGGGAGGLAPAAGGGGVGGGALPAAGGGGATLGADGRVPSPPSASFDEGFTIARSYHQRGEGAVDSRSRRCIPSHISCARIRVVLGMFNDVGLRHTHRWWCGRWVKPWRMQVRFGTM